VARESLDHIPFEHKNSDGYLAAKKRVSIAQINLKLNLAAIVTGNAKQRPLTNTSPWLMSLIQPSPMTATTLICGKRKFPRVKCGDCNHQAYVPVSDEVIRDRPSSG